MELVQHLPQVIPIEMGVDLGGGDAFVSQHFLDGTQVGTTFDKVGGKTVPEGVRADVFLEPDTLNLFFDDEKYHHAAEFFAPFVEKDKLFVAFGRLDMDADVLDVDAEVLQGIPADGDEALLVPLADNPQKADVGEDLAGLEVREFRYPEPRTVEDFEHGAVAVALGAAEGDAFEDIVDFVVAEGIREFAAEFGRFEELGGVFADFVLVHKKPVKSLDARHDAGLGVFRNLQFGEAIDEIAKVFEFRSRRMHIGETRLHVAAELLDVLGIGQDGIFAERSFQFEVVLELLQE